MVSSSRFATADYLRNDYCQHGGKIVIKLTLHKEYNHT
jgi:hypothetical protein